MNVITAKTANDAWTQAAELLCEQDDSHVQPSRGGRTRELLHVLLNVSDPTARWVVSRTPAINPAFAIAEVVWILAGRQDSAFLNYWNPALPRFAGAGEIYYGAYGFRLRHHFGPDQIRTAFKALQSNQDSRQIVLQIWDPRMDLPDPDGFPRAADIPCNVCSLLKLRQGKLEWLQVMRSNDILLGLPHNLVQFTYLQEIFAAWLEVELGAYWHLSDSLHVYVEDLNSLQTSDKSLTPAPNTDRWDSDYSASQEILENMIERMDMMRRPTLTVQELREASRLRVKNTSARNMLLIVAADAARRRCYGELVDEFANQCTNPALLQGWQRWNERQAAA